MAEQADTSLRSSLEDRYCELQSRLQAALNIDARLEVELADAVVHSGELEREHAVERGLRQSLEEAVQDNNFVATLERMVARHAAALQDERVHSERLVARHAVALQDERAHLEEVRARLEDRLEAATIRHEEAILELVARHRSEVSQRLDQNQVIFARIARTLEEP
jgi:hypothetical protein